MGTDQNKNWNQDTTKPNQKGDIGKTPENPSTTPVTEPGKSTTPPTTNANR
jgi:hypothetical protein